MEMFIGNGDNEDKKACNLGEVAKMGYKQRHDKPYDKHIIKNADGPDVELYFFELLEMSYDDLLDMYNDYTQMYTAFGDYGYKLNAKIAMEALQTKGAKEVNVS